MIAPKISVIIPVYNAEKYLDEALMSIVQQSFKDFEVIAIDDGSTDNSLAILRKYESKDSRFIIKTRENKGIAHTLNEGIKMAKGKYIARMDADDSSLPDRFYLQYHYMESHPDCVATGGFYEHFDDGGSTNHLTHEHSELLLVAVSGSPQITHWTQIIFKRAWCEWQHRALKTSKYNKVLIGADFFVPHPAAFIRQSALTKLGDHVYRPDFVPLEDYELFLRLANLGRLGSIDSVVLRQRNAPNSLGQSSWPTPLLEQFANLSVYEYCLEGKSEVYSFDEKGVHKFLQKYGIFSLERILFSPIFRNSKDVNPIIIFIYRLLRYLFLKVQLRVNAIKVAKIKHILGKRLVSIVKNKS